MAQIDQLTDAEIIDYYMHPRDANGNIKFPEPEPEPEMGHKSLEKLLTEIESIGKVHKWSRVKIEAKKKVAAEKWQEKSKV